MGMMVSRKMSTSCLNICFENKKSIIIYIIVYIIYMFDNIIYNLFYIHIYIYKFNRAQGLLNRHHPQNPGVFFKAFKGQIIFEKSNFLSCENSARTSLLMILIVCCGGVPVLEQPASSLVMEHDRMVWMLEILSKIKIPAPKLQTLYCSLSNTNGVHIDLS